MKKRVTSILTASILIIALTACSKVTIEIGNANPTPTPEGPSTEIVTEAPPVESVPAQVTDTPAQPTTTPTAANTATPTPEPEISARPAHPLTESHLTPQVKAALDEVQTDYHKVYWGTEYTMPNLEGIVVSVSPCRRDSKQIIVGLTNLYDKDVTLSADGYAMDALENDIGSFHIFEEAIRSGQTVIHTIYCSKETPNGSIHWNTAKLMNTDKSSVYWEGDWQISIDNTIHYQIASEDPMKLGYVWMLILDGEGYVVDYCYDYNPDDISTNISGSVNTYKDALGAADMALFANPLRAY